MLFGIKAMSRQDVFLAALQAGSGVAEPG